MKLKITLSLIAGALTCLTSCLPDKPVTLSDLKDPTTADSLVYYLVQLRAHDYWQRIENDTSLRSPEQRERFLKGLKDGIAQIRPGEDAYNNGVRMGTRLAKNLYEFEREYGVKTNHDLLMLSFQTGLRGLNDIPEIEYQEKYYELLGRLKAGEQKKQEGKVRHAMVSTARKRGMTRIGNELYGKVTLQGEGHKATTGDVVIPTVSYEMLDGENLGLPSPARVVVGAPGMPEAFNMAFMQLADGGSGEFITPAQALFGSRTANMGLDPEDILVVKIHINDIRSGANAGETDTYQDAL